MSLYSNENDGFKFILGCVDLYTRFAFCVPLKNKNADTVTKAFKYIFDKTGIIPKKLWTDRGLEFYNKKLDTLREQHNIEIYSTYGNSKSVIVERFFRTLKSKMFKIFTTEQNHKWIDILNSLVDNYNQSKHTGVENNKPKDMLFDNIRIKNNDEESKEDVKPKFKIGDRVRVSLKKGVFQKGYDANWSWEIYKIHKIVKGNPVTYKIIDENNEKIEGSWYNEELKKTGQKENVYLVEKVIKTRKIKGKKQYFVKWTGYDEKYNSWVNEEDLDHNFKNIDKL